MNKIVQVLVTYEDGSTYTVSPKLAPDVQGTSLEDLQSEPEGKVPGELATPVEVVPAAPVEETPAEPVEPAEEVPATE